MKFSRQTLSSLLISQLLLLCLTPNFVYGGPCTVNAQCGNVRPLCKSNQCSFCGSDADCATFMPEKPQCVLNRCIKGCTTNADCLMPAASKCDGGRCVVCTADSDCTSNPNIPAGSTCNTSLKSCVKSCSTNADCPVLYQPSCGGGICSGACFANTDCARFPKTPVCVNSIACVECTQDSDCPSASMTCNNNRCVCSSNSQCTKDDLSKCQDNVCQPCSVDSDCSHVTGKNSCSAGKCVWGPPKVSNSAINETETSSVSSGVIIGATIGSVAGALLIAGIASYLYARRKRLQRVSMANSAQTKNKAQTELSPVDQKQQA